MVKPIKPKLTKARKKAKPRVRKKEISKRIKPSRRVRPTTAKAPQLLGAAPIAPTEQDILQRLLDLLRKFRGRIPDPNARIGDLVPDLDILATEINETFKLPPGRRFRSGEIRPEWTVLDLAREIAMRLQPGPMGQPIMAAAGTTLERLQSLIISRYHDPAPPGAPVASLVQDLSALARDINEEWGLQPPRAFRANEIDGTWSLNYLAGVIDTKI